MTPKEMLESVGFKMSQVNFGTTRPEPIDVGKDHFAPRFRDVFIGETFNHHFYVTSHIHGLYRGYRCRLYNAYEKTLMNIFGMGTTAEQAVQDFINHFTANPKVYNCSR